MNKLKPHPFSQIIPAMSDAEFALFKAGVVAAGRINDPITLYKGMILDGRHRYRVHVETKIPVKFESFKGTDADALALVTTRSARRELNDTQKACAALESMPHFQKLATARLRGDKSQNIEGKSRDHVGQLFRVSGRYVSEAMTVRDADPDLFRQCFEGRTFLSVAKREIARRNKAKAHRAIVTRLTPREGEKDQWEVFTGDAIEAMEARPAGKVRLIFADPRYNIGIDYGRGAKADRLPEGKYLSWCEDWLAECARILTKDGSLFVMIDGAHLAPFEALLRGESGKVPAMHRRNVIIWHETFGNYESGNFTNCWRAILYFTKSEKNYVWHGDQILIPSDRQLKYADSRANPAGKVPSNVWDFPRVVDNAKERVPGVPTQIPQALVERIVLCASDPGDLVFDPFTGSGTTGAAAVTHHRKFAGSEINPKFAELARARIARAIAERKA